jgi:hypothetical protein
VLPVFVVQIDTIFEIFQQKTFGQNFATGSTHSCSSRSFIRFDKEGEALRCKIGPTFYQKIMLDIE